MIGGRLKQLITMLNGERTNMYQQLSCNHVAVIKMGLGWEIDEVSQECVNPSVLETVPFCKTDFPWGRGRERREDFFKSYEHYDLTKDAIIIQITEVTPIRYLQSDQPAPLWQRKLVKWGGHLLPHFMVLLYANGKPTNTFQQEFRSF